MTEAVAALAALGQEKRLVIFRQLVAAGPDGLVAGELGSALGMPPATLSFHLKELSHARLVEAEPLGRFVRYRATFTTMAELVGYLTDDCCGGIGLAGCMPANAKPRIKRKR